MNDWIRSETAGIKRSKRAAATTIFPQQQNGWIEIYLDIEVVVVKQAYGRMLLILFWSRSRVESNFILRGSCEIKML